MPHQEPEGLPRGYLVVRSLGSTRQQRESFELRWFLGVDPYEQLRSGKEGRCQAGVTIISRLGLIRYTLVMDVDLFTPPKLLFIAVLGFALGFTLDRCDASAHAQGLSNGGITDSAARMASALERIASVLERKK